MKKTLLLIGVVMMFVATSIAQEKSELTSKNGDVILPVAGDYSIGIDAGPFFRYLGNMFNNTANNAAPTWNGYTNYPYVLIGKKMADDNTAYRGVLAITRSSSFDQREVTKAEALPLPPAYFGDSIKKVIDTRSRTNSGSVVIGGGIEKRRGYGRLQGLYGAELLISYEGCQKKSYTYGNPLTQNAQQNQPNVNPSDPTYTTNWSTVDGDVNIGSTSGGQITQYAGVASARLLESKTNGSFGIGARGFVGVEYFFVPKMAIGGEFGWGLGYVVQGTTTNKWEAEGYLADGSEGALTITEKLTRNHKSDFRINEQNAIGTFPYNGLLNYIQPNGAIRLSFYF